MPKKKALFKSLLGWLRKGSNILSVVALVISGVTLYYRLFSPPSRANLTLFIDHTEFKYVSGNNDFDLTVFIRVVNDSPKTATIRTWDLLLNYNVTYEILKQTDSKGSLLLRPSAQTDFIMTRTLIGQNNTVLHSSALRSIIVSMLYEDEIGILETKRECSFAS